MPDLKPDLTKEPVSALLRELDAVILQQLQSYAIQHVVLGLSGGLDSMLLLQLLVRWRARAPDRNLQAVHVHHGLSTNADAWVEFCQQRLTRPECGAPNTLTNFEAALDEIFAQATPGQQTVLTEWRDYAQQLRLRYAL